MGIEGPLELVIYNGWLLGEALCTQRCLQHKEPKRVYSYGSISRPNIRCKFQVWFTQLRALMSKRYWIQHHSFANGGYGQAFWNVWAPFLKKKKRRKESLIMKNGLMLVPLCYTCCQKVLWFNLYVHLFIYSIGLSQGIKKYQVRTLQKLQKMGSKLEL